MTNNANCLYVSRVIFTNDKYLKEKKGLVIVCIIKSILLCRSNFAAWNHGPIDDQHTGKEKQACKDSI